MVQINEQKCIGCGKCVADCFPGKIQLMEGKAHTDGTPCMECGHCIAICPANAITLPGYDMSEVIEKPDSQIDPEVYLNNLKFTRSIRQFKDTPVTEEQLQMIIDAGRYSATGGNLQNVKYFVSQQDITNFKEMVLDQLKEMGLEARANGNGVSWYGDFWIKMHEDYQRDHIDRLFFDAGTVIVVSSNSPQSAIIAASHMETMVYSLGLGMLYSGFTERAICCSPELQAYLQLPEDYNAYAVLVIGTPDVTYQRTVPRKPADIVRN